MLSLTALAPKSTRQARQTKSKVTLADKAYKVTEQHAGNLLQQEQGIKWNSAQWQEFRSNFADKFGNLDEIGTLKLCTKLTGLYGDDIATAYSKLWARHFAIKKAITAKAS